jgi:predicted O-methyltransferase YrrM
MIFNEMVELIESWGSDCINRFGGTHNGGIYLQQEPREITSLILFLQSQDLKNINYLEIGCAAGGFTYVMNYFLDIKNNILIDDDKHKMHVKLADVLKGIQYNKWVGDSQSKQAREFVLNLNLEFDIIFIDADHSYKGVKKDTEQYVKFLKRGGFIVYHDIVERGCGIKTWTNEIVGDKLFGLKNVINFIQNKNRLGIGVYQK